MTDTNGTSFDQRMLSTIINIVFVDQCWKDHPTIVICLKPDLFLAECAKDLISMNIKRRPPAIYYACPDGNQLDGASWGSTSECLITTTGLTILETLDANMESLLHLNRVCICSTIKDLLLNNLDITSVWTFLKHYN